MSSGDFFQADKLLRAGDASGAADVLRALVEASPEHVAGWRKLAEALERIGDEADAAEAHARADRIEADHISDVGASMMFHGDLDRARTFFDRALALDPDCIQAHWLLGDYHSRFGPEGQALYHYRRCHEIAPDREAPAFMVAALGDSKGVPDRAPDDYVSEYFDWYAAHFDEHLVGNLQYVGPQAATAALARVRPDGFGDLLDLGCGTGLVGEQARGHFTRLVGVDLSADMLAQARKRDIYDELRHGELVEVLGGMEAASFDTALAADVLIYIGAVEATLEHVARVLRADGVFVSTFEENPDASRWTLSRSGRYLHGEAYLSAAGAAAGFAHVAVERLHLRQEYNEPVPGLLAVFRKRA